MLGNLLEVRRVPAAESESEAQLIELMNQHERPIYNFLLGILRDGDVALDCAQDTFLRAFEHLRKGKPVTAQWLYTVARNRAIDVFRDRKRVQPELERLEHLPVNENTDEIVGVRQTLEQLPAGDRELLYLFDIVGYKTDEIGKILGIRGSAVRQRLTRARERFRAIYGVEA